MTLEIPKRPARKFIPEDFSISSFDAIKPFLDELLNAALDSPAALRKWFKNRSELESIISEDMGWRYVRMTCFTENETYQKSYQDFIQNIQPHLAPISDQLNQKALASPFLKNIEKEPGFNLMVRNMKKSTTATLPEVIRMASLTPAERCGIGSQVGSIEQGKSADLLVIDARLKVRRVFVQGEEITLRQSGAA